MNYRKELGSNNVMPHLETAFQARNNADYTPAPMFRPDEGAGGVLRRDVRGDAGAERERRAAPGVGGQDVGGGRDDPRGGHRRVSGRRGG